MEECSILMFCIIICSTIFTHVIASIPPATTPLPRGLTEESDFVTKLLLLNFAFDVLLKHPVA